MKMNLNEQQSENTQIVGQTQSGQSAHPELLSENTQLQGNPPSQVNIPPQPYPQPYPQSPVPVSATNNKRNTSLIVWIIILATLLLAAGGFALWYFVIRDDGSKEKTESSQSSSTTNDVDSTTNSPVEEFMTLVQKYTKKFKAVTSKEEFDELKNESMREFKALDRKYPDFKPTPDEEKIIKDAYEKLDKIARDKEAEFTYDPYESMDIDDYDVEDDWDEDEEIEEVYDEPSSPSISGQHILNGTLNGDNVNFVMNADYDGYVYSGSFYNAKLNLTMQLRGNFASDSFSVYSIDHGNWTFDATRQSDGSYRGVASNGSVSYSFWVR